MNSAKPMEKLFSFIFSEPNAQEKASFSSSQDFSFLLLFQETANIFSGAGLSIVCSESS